MEDEQPLGEYPELPAELIHEKHINHGLDLLSDLLMSEFFKGRESQ